MKIFSILISLMISFNLIAAEASGSRLSSIVDDFHYAVSVEWDQKDQAEFKKISDNFQSELTKVIQQENLTKAELNLFLESRVIDKKILSGLQTKVNLMSPSPTSAEVFSLVEDAKTSMYSRGASWDGTVLIIPIGIIVMAILIIMAFRNADKTCEDNGQVTVTEQTNCGIRSVCVSHGENYCLAYADQYMCDERTFCQ